MTDSKLTAAVEGGVVGTRSAPPSTAQIFRTDSRPLSLTSNVLGGAALAVALLGTLITVLVYGVGTYKQVAAGLQSTAVQAVCGTALVLAVAAGLLGGLPYRSLDTRVARSQATNGMILAGQGAVAAILIMVFVRGDMVTFTRNFLNFPNVGKWFSYFVTGFVNTLILTVSSTAGGLVIGLIVAMFLTSNRRVLRGPARVYVNVLRGLPMLVEIALVYFGLALGLNIGLTAGQAMIIALALNAGAYMAEVFRAGLQSIGKGQVDAARGLGLTYGQALRYAIIPQAARRVIPPLMNDFITVTKETSLLAFLGVTLGGRDLYTVAMQGYSQFFNSTFFVAAGAGYLVITLPLIWLVGRIEKRVRSGLVGVES